MQLKAASLCVICCIWPAAIAHAENVTFCYHQFDHSLDNVYSVLPEVFAWEIGYLQHNQIPIISLEEFSRQFLQEKQLGRNALLTVDDGWADIKNILPIAQANKIPLTLFLYPSVLEKQTHNYLTSAEAEELAANPLLSFGCHSYTHPLLHHQTAEQLNRELIDSKTWLESRLHRPLPDFAYPFGMFDRAAKEAVEANYRLAFGVDDGPNSAAHDPFNLRRFVLYRTTTLGEFIEMANTAGSNTPREYRVKCLGFGHGASHYFTYVKSKLYQYPETSRPKKVLVIPGSEIGAAWLGKIVKHLVAQDAEVVVLVNRNNNIPFYRPVKEMKDMLNWDVGEYLEDLRSVLEYLEVDKNNWAVITWGDGFDLVAALLASKPEYGRHLQGMVALNPSILAPAHSQPADFAKEVQAYDSQLAAGEYASQNLKVFLKMKTLSDLMVLKPDAPSPLALKLGYPPETTNKNLLTAEFDKEDHPDLGLDYASSHYSENDFKTAFMQPWPVFSMVVPLRWVRDVHELWAEDFSDPKSGMVHKAELHLTVLPLVTPDYEPNLERIQKTFPNLNILPKVKFEELSTIELLLSDQAAEEITKRTGIFLNLPAHAVAETTGTQEK